MRLFFFLFLFTQLSYGEVLNLGSISNSHDLLGERYTSVISEEERISSLNHFINDKNDDFLKLVTVNVNNSQKFIHADDEWKTLLEGNL